MNGRGLKRQLIDGDRAHSFFSSSETVDAQPWCRVLAACDRHRANVVGRDLRLRAEVFREANLGVAALVWVVVHPDQKVPLSGGDVHLCKAWRVDHEVEHDWPVSLHKALHHKSVHVELFGNLRPLVAELFRCWVVREDLAGDHRSSG